MNSKNKRVEWWGEFSGEEVFRRTGKHPASGFTLIELLVVVLIIGILSAVAVPQYTKAVAKARAAEGLAMMKSLSAGFEEYVLANGTLPDSFDQLTLAPGITSPDASGCIASKNFRYCIQNGPRLQSWANRNPTYGFIWYSSMQNIGTPGKKFYCFVNVGTEADQMKICELIGGKNKITSPTAGASYNWYALD